MPPLGLGPPIVTIHFRSQKAHADVRFSNRPVWVKRFHIFCGERFSKTGGSDWHVSDIRARLLFGRDGVESRHRADRPKSR
jgi:hypothetical protein